MKKYQSDWAEVINAKSESQISLSQELILKYDSKKVNFMLRILKASLGLWSSSDRNFHLTIASDFSTVALALTSY